LADSQPWGNPIVLTPTSTKRRLQRERILARKKKLLFALKPDDKRFNSIYKGRFPRRRALEEGVSEENKAG